MTRPISILLGAPLHREIMPSLQWVEVATTFQIPSFQIIGLPSPEVAEARDRIRAAVESIGQEFPRKRVILNLSPANIKKRGTGLDLAMALAVLVSQLHSKERKKDPCDESLADPIRMVAWGELGLDGKVKPMGQLTRTVYACWEAQASFLLVSDEEYLGALQALEWVQEARVFLNPAPVVIPVKNLRSAWQSIESSEFLKFKNPSDRGLNRWVSVQRSFSNFMPLPPALERVIAVAAFGLHHVLILGPKGIGKSHALEWLIAVRSGSSHSLSLKAAFLEELRTASGSSPGRDQILAVPVRRVGPQVRAGALVGTVTSCGVQAGEFALADGGLLIADELPEWSRDAREALREPLERGKVSVNRVHGAVEMSARFQLAANGNLCPCGGLPSEFLGSGQDFQKSAKYSSSLCRCSERIKRNYLARLSGPVLDRIDLLFLHHGGRAPAISLCSERRSLSELKEKVDRCFEKSSVRWGVPAANLLSGDLEKMLTEHPRWLENLQQIPVTSLRARHKILRVALSLSLWDGNEEPSLAHFFEASCYRPESVTSSSVVLQ